jgi:anti-sigma regulatory factor (Ser/Thr protein kinase)
MTLPQPRRFEASLELFQELRGHAERYCADAGIDREVSGRLVLVLEELFANTVEHGYRQAAGGAAEKPVWLTLTAAGNAVEVVYEDAAPAHDPFSKAVAPDYSGPVDSWQVGGVGVALVIKLGRNVSYDRIRDRNCIRFTIPPRRAGI